MDKFFSPKSVAVFGASRSLEKPGRVVVQNLLHSGFSGKIYPVNPHADEIANLEVFTSETVPKADLGVFVIPAKIVPKNLEIVADRLKSALVISGGFGESGNSELDTRLLEISKKYDLRIWGPNCLGLMNTHQNFNLTFLPTSRLPMPPKGGVSILSQSGATVASVLDWAGTIQLGISKVASYGNQLDVSDYEILDYYQKDKETSVIGFYVEGLKEGKKLLEVAREGKKPVIVLKAGKTGSGVRAAKSHTGALAGNFEVFKGISSQLKWGMACGPEEFLLSLKARNIWQSHIKNVGVVTCGGGFGVMVSDSLEELGMGLSNFSEKTTESLKKAFPQRVSIKNPVDLTGDATPEMFGTAIDALMSDGSVDAIVVVLLMQLPKLNSEIIDILQNYSDSEKPVVVVSPPGAYASGINKLITDLPVVSSPEKAAGVLRVIR